MTELGILIMLALILITLIIYLPKIISLLYIIAKHYNYTEAVEIIKGKDYI